MLLECGCSNQPPISYGLPWALRRDLQSIERREPTSSWTSIDGPSSPYRQIGPLPTLIIQDVDIQAEAEGLGIAQGEYI